MTLVFQINLLLQRQQSFQYSRRPITFRWRFDSARLNVKWENVPFKLIWITVIWFWDEIIYLYPSLFTSKSSSSCQPIRPIRNICHVPFDYTSVLLSTATAMRRNKAPVSTLLPTPTFNWRRITFNWMNSSA